MGYLLFVDTESDTTTKEPYSIQILYNNTYNEFTVFDDESYAIIHDIWIGADAIIMFNAPYDMGVLSAIWAGKNSYNWTVDNDTSYWTMILFGCKYTVKRINGFRNNIRAYKQVCDKDGTVYRAKSRRPSSPPIIDVLKLWSILVDNGTAHSISLKSLIERELGEKSIHYSAESVKTEAYRRQDVEALKKLWHVFLARVNPLSDVRNNTLEDWSKVCTPATLCKNAYSARYPELKDYQDKNHTNDDKFGLSSALSDAYHGGFTVALYRGKLHNIAWYDIHGAYAHVIEYENTDQYLMYVWSKRDPRKTPLRRDNAPYLCKCSSNVVIASINKSLKIYKLTTPANVWMWSYDILALRLLFDDAHICIYEMYAILPGVNVRESMTAQWSKLKAQEEKEHGKTTLREYYKLLSNTSYGIKAQRNPYPTKHTNMAIAGIITSRAHLILCEMIDEARLHNCIWRYSDTDSIAVSMFDTKPDILERAINARVYPYSVECEACNSDIQILSLKRYISTNRHSLDGKKLHDKICLHGKSIYKISQNEILDMINGARPSHKPLKLASVAGNTERTLNRVLKLNPCCFKHQHPFMFETDCISDISIYDWYTAWYAHIDTKLSFPENAGVNDEFVRDFRTFSTNTCAYLFYGSMRAGEETASVYNDVARDYDNEDEYFYDSSSCLSLDTGV